MTIGFDKFKPDSENDVYVGIFVINYRYKQNGYNTTYLINNQTNSGESDNSTLIPFYLSITKKMHSIEKHTLKPDFTNYGLLNYEENSFDLYEIAPKDNQNDLMIIEYSSCSAKIDFILGDKIPTGELNEFHDLTELNENYQKESINGKTVITTKNKNGRKTHYLLIKPNQGEANRLCRVNNQKGCLDVSIVEYYVKFKSVKESELINYEPEGGKGELLFIFRYN